MQHETQFLPKFPSNSHCCLVGNLNAAEVISNLNAAVHGEASVDWGKNIHLIPTGSISFSLVLMSIFFPLA